MDTRILIVDDEPSIRVGMRSYFRARGYAVDCAAERVEAEALLAKVPYSCVIADLCLSSGRGPDGLEVVASARSLQPEIPIVILTAYGSPAVEAEARRLGANAFLSKPQSLDELASIVGGLLEGGR